MLRKGVIELRGNFSELGELSPWDVGEIVMLNVISDVQVDEVHWSIVGVSVLATDEFVMFSNDVHSDWVKTKAESGTEDQVGKGLATESVQDESIPSEDDNHIDNFHNGWGFSANNVRSETIEEWHNEDVQELSESGGEESDFPLGRKIGVPVRSAEEDVVISMISAESN